MSYITMYTENRITIASTQFELLYFQDLFTNYIFLYTILPCYIIVIYFDLAKCLLLEQIRWSHSCINNLGSNIYFKKNPSLV